MIQRLSSASAGRSRAVAYNGLVWMVATAKDENNFMLDVRIMLSTAEDTLLQMRSSKDNLISVNVYLKDIHLKPEFDAIWDEWIGADPVRWPQRICIQTVLTPGLSAEIQITAATDIDRRSL